LHEVAWLGAVAAPDNEAAIQKVRNYAVPQPRGRLPAGFVIPTQPVLASKPPSGVYGVHEIKHDG
jgi:hypothetical protein